MDDTRQSGFTLIELLVTLSLVALLAGIAVPAMGRFVDNARLRSAVEHLTQDLQQARNHAINFQRTVFFSIYRSGGYWCYGWSDLQACDCTGNGSAGNSCVTAQPAATTQRRLSSDFNGTRIHLNRNVQQYTLQFSPLRGVATASSVRLANAHREMRIVVSPLGRIRSCSTTKGSGQC